MTTDRLREGYLAAADRLEACSGDDPLTVGISLTEMLFWWRCLDEVHVAARGKSPASLPSALAALRPGLVWARNVATHEDVVVAPVSGRSWPQRWPRRWDPRVIWRDVDTLPPPAGSNQEWKDLQIAAYRTHFSGDVTETAVAVMSEWVAGLARPTRAETSR